MLKINELENILMKTEPETLHHSEDVQQIIEILLDNIRNRLSLETSRENILVAARYHDLGKTEIDPNVLYKRGDLTEEERKIVNQHPEKGVEVLDSIQINDIQMKKAIRDAILLHHKSNDGKIGYPYDYSGTIPNFVKLISIADVFSALTMKRCYKEPIPFEEAVDKILSDDKYEDNVKEIFKDALPDLKLHLKNKYSLKNMINQLQGCENKTIENSNHDKEDNQAGNSNGDAR